MQVSILMLSESEDSGGLLARAISCFYVSNLKGAMRRQAV